MDRATVQNNQICCDTLSTCTSNFVDEHIGIYGSGVLNGGPVQTPHKKWQIWRKWEGAV